MFLHLVDGGFELGVPLFAETAYERLALEYVEGNVLRLTFEDCVATYVPTMVGDARESGGELFLAYGVQVAAEGFGAEKASVTSAVSTVAAGDYGCDHLAFGVGVCDALAVDGGLCRGREMWPQGVKFLFYLSDFIDSNGGSGIAFLTAAAVAFVYVAAEAFGDDVAMYDDIADHEHGGNLVSYHWMGCLP